MDFCFRNHEIILRAWVVVVRGKAKEVLETGIPTERVWGEGLDRLVVTSRKAPQVSILDFLKVISSTTACPVATGMQMTGGEKKPEEEKVTPGNKPVVAGTAVFQNYKLAGWLDETETRGFLWVKGKVKGGIIVVPSPENPDRLMALEITYSASKIEPEINGGRLQVTVRIREEGNISEIDPDNLKISRPETIERINALKKKSYRKGSAGGHSQSPGN